MQLEDDEMPALEYISPPIQVRHPLLKIFQGFKFLKSAFLYKMIKLFIWVAFFVILYTVLIGTGLCKWLFKCACLTLEKVYERPVTIATFYTIYRPICCHNFG